MLGTGAPPSDIHTVIDGLIVLGLAALVGIGIGLIGGQRRTHEALFGYKEGTTDVPGIVTIVKGNGHGSLLEVCETALTAAQENGEALSRHAEVDEERWEQVTESLRLLGQGQADAAELVVQRHPELATVTPITKKAAPRKRAAPKKAPAK